jgi:hypothetical protein
MKAHELRKGDEYREDGKLIYTVIRDADEFTGENDKPEVYVEVRYAGDGGHSDRVFPRDKNVPHIRPIKED